MNRIKIVLKEDRTLHEMLLGIACSGEMESVVPALYISDKLIGMLKSAALKLLIAHP